jgi:hypothetical protein
MNKMQVGILAMVAWIVMGFCLGLVAEEYAYPVQDPMVASVVGTPQEFMPLLPEEIRSKDYAIEIFPNRVVPDLFWNEQKCRFSLAYQKESAPLIFVIAGTGASYQSPKMKMLEKVFYNEGYHVICISSPTHPNFIVSSSTSSCPGDMEQDVGDLYRVMELALNKVAEKIEVTDFFLTGYSLGGTQSAFLSKLDEERQVFNFKKVLMINPSVSLFNSVGIIDDMLVENIPGGLDHFVVFFQDMMSKFSKLYGRIDHINFDSDFLYEVYKEMDENADESRVKALIGTSFRISLANMVFTSDAMSRAGVIVPPNDPLSKYEHTTDFFKVCSRMSFKDYFQEILYPHFQKKKAGITQDDVVQSVSLRIIQDYLQNTEKLGVMMNEDDFILMADEVDFLRDTLGDRAVVYPIGGHCGNMGYQDNVERMVEFLR